MGRRAWNNCIAEAAEIVVGVLLPQIDPTEERYPDYPSWGHLRAELEEVLDAAVDDWILQKREELEPKPAPD